MNKLIKKTNEEFEDIFIQNEIYKISQLETSLPSQNDLNYIEKSKFFINLIEDKNYIINDIWEVIYIHYAMSNVPLIISKEKRSQITRLINIYLGDINILEEIKILKNNYPNSIYDQRKFIEVYRCYKNTSKDNLNLNNLILENLELFNFNINLLDFNFVKTNLIKILVKYSENEKVLYYLLKNDKYIDIFKQNMINQIIEMYINTNKWNYNLLNELKKKKSLKKETLYKIDKTLNNPCNNPHIIKGPSLHFSIYQKVPMKNNLSYENLDLFFKSIIDNGKISILEDISCNTFSLNGNNYLPNNQTSFTNFIILANKVITKIEGLKENLNIYQYLSNIINVELNKDSNYGFFALDDIDVIANDSLVSKNRFIVIQIEMLLKQWDCLQNENCIKKEYFSIHSQINFNKKLTLLTKNEEDFFNYMLNNKTFEDNKALRNYYLHGGCTSDHKTNNTWLLLLLIMVVYKMKYFLENKDL